MQAVLFSTSYFSSCKIMMQDVSTVIQSFFSVYYFCLLHHHFLYPSENYIYKDNRSLTQDIQNAIFKKLFSPPWQQKFYTILQKNLAFKLQWGYYLAALNTRHNMVYNLSISSNVFFFVIPHISFLYFKKSDSTFILHNKCYLLPLFYKQMIFRHRFKIGFQFHQSFPSYSSQRNILIFPSSVRIHLISLVQI